MESKIEIKQADRSNFTESSMDSFDRFQEVHHVYRPENGSLVLKEHPFTETWSPERKREKAAEILSGRYVTFCAFDDDTVIGEIMLIPELNGNRLIIDSFHVSRPFRRHGIGRRLLDAAADYARSRGANALYASCCSAEETIRFYLAVGFRPSEHPIPSFAEAEPFDIQMECSLSAKVDPDIRGYMDERGRLTALPTKRKKKLIALSYLADSIPADTVYTEMQFNELLNTLHTFGDPATLRRELYDFFLINRSRDGSEYSANPDRLSAEALIEKYAK